MYVEPTEGPQHRGVSRPENGGVGGRAEDSAIHEMPSPIGPIPATPGQDIVLPDSFEVSPRSLAIKGRRAALTLEVQIGRRSMAESVRPLSADHSRNDLPAPGAE